MKRSTRIVKRLLALFLVVLMSINSFGAVVGDNDGSAFITKAEFDSLKNSFQAQINQYNTSIDSKIDGAIAGYLAGIRSVRTESVPHLSTAYAPGVLMVDKDFLTTNLVYKYGRWNVSVIIENNRYAATSGFHAKVQATTKSGQIGNGAFNIVDKIIKINGLNYGLWTGYNNKVQCSLIAAMTKIANGNSPYSQPYLGGLRWTGNGYKSDLNVGLFTGGISAANSSDENALSTTDTYDYALNTITITYDGGGWMYENLCILDDGNYGGEFHVYNDEHYLMNDASRTENRVSWVNNLNLKSLEMKDTNNTITAVKFPTLSTKDQNLYGGPSLGFNPNITKWNQILSDDIKLNNQNLPLTSGVPIVTLNKDQTCEFEVSFNDSSYNYQLYVKDGEFSGEPSESECEIITATTNGIEITGKVVTIQNGLGTIKYNNDNLKEGTLFMKWKKVSKPTNDDDGMLLIDENTTVTVNINY